ncbi:MAG: hypothetical protein WB014_07245 [Methanosarcina sp.]
MPIFILAGKHDHITTVHITTNATPGEHGPTAPKGPKRASRECRSRIHYRRS